MLLLHSPLDIVDGFVIDSLHSIYLGVTLHLLSYWFGVKHNRQPYSIRSKVFLFTYVYRYSIVQQIQFHYLHICLNAMRSTSVQQQLSLMLFVVCYFICRKVITKYPAVYICRLSCVTKGYLQSSHQILSPGKQDLLVNIVIGKVHVHCTLLSSVGKCVG